MREAEEAVSKAVLKERSNVTTYWKRRLQDVLDRHMKTLSTVKFTKAELHSVLEAPRINFQRLVDLEQRLDAEAKEASNLLNHAKAAKAQAQGAAARRRSDSGPQSKRQPTSNSTGQSLPSRTVKAQNKGTPRRNGAPPRRADTEEVLRRFQRDSEAARTEMAEGIGQLRSLLLQIKEQQVQGSPPPSFDLEEGLGGASGFGEEKPGGPVVDRQSHQGEDEDECQRDLGTGELPSDEELAPISSEQEATRGTEIGDEAGSMVSGRESDSEEDGSASYSDSEDDGEEEDEDSDMASQSESESESESD